ncbi:pectate lyase [Dysgonomonas sp. PFB1-18]|uniref:pectate lyase family protein n=1 Tax=unclassified Dysgonomonas TaxID=2630389 RepID=UPI0024764EFA|nr:MULTISPECIES: pectate lyase [unclassified Dysgonomonas]MDH6307955.1 pectate lyase [Dysgonomonas sp. PF1-14]MDH6339494.1 pectate lyase [Dysgonomonas sp. PF1-16]MDH6381145.1 pectate lyase [Dysgonomonas sp. PFB1-18]MDH6398357.1 pectate lyase [Dysgonomonas sp. PF1-23]
MKKIILFLTGAIFSIVIYAQTPAFPGAEGGGMYTTGGRGGKVYYVNSLEDTIMGNKKTQEGTLRWCLKRPGPKTILFKVAGIIHLKARLNIPDSTTIAGQSAPGDGICITNYPVKVEGNNVIIRYIRFRMGDLSKVTDDALSGNRNKDIIIDHCSMSWSTDECASFYDNENFTMQWCIISESLRASVHKKGNHGYGAIWGGKKASYHHNLLAHHDSRNPRMCGSRYSNQPELELVDFRNNVIYNWGSNSGYAGEGGRYNFVNNYYKPTPTSANPSRIFSPNADDGSNKQPKGVWGTFYVNGNHVHGNKKVTRNNLLGLQPNNLGSKNKADLISDKPFDVPCVTTDDAETAYKKVLVDAGASYRRDKTDLRIVDEVEKGLAPKRASGSAGTKPGMIDSQYDVGGWDTYSYDSEDVPADSNIDGIPDGWLEQHYSGKSANDLNEEGYTYLEVYLNSLIVKQ